MTIENLRVSDQLNKEAWEALAHKISKELWLAQYRTEHPGATPDEVNKAWNGNVVRIQRKVTKTALRKLEAKGILFVERADTAA